MHKFGVEKDIFLFAKLSIKNADENDVLILMSCVFEHTILKMSVKKP